MANGGKLQDSPRLMRQMGIMGLAATGICSMMGASINVVPFMIQRNIEGIGPYVLPAFILAAVPALFAAFAYAALASAMPRAGGSYIYASRGLNPYLGFIASFSQWFGLSIVIGVIAYIIIPFLRDIAIAAEWASLGVWLENGAVRVILALLLIWIFVAVNIRGTKVYERILIPMMIMMFLLGSIVIISGFAFNHSNFAQAILERDNELLPEGLTNEFSWSVLFSASALLFASFIGFDSIAQAGGEAKNPSRSLPIAIGIAIGSVGIFYFVFTGAVYHAVPWEYMFEKAQTMDVSAPGLLAYLLPPGLSIAILSGAAIALINDLPAMLLSVSRLMFAWSKDGVFPNRISSIHSRYRTPHVALVLSGVIASIGVLGSHFAGDFFLGIDIMVTSMMVNFLLMCATLIAINTHNPFLAGEINLGYSDKIRKTIGWSGVILLSFLLIVHIRKDVYSDVDAWYFHSTWVWIIVMGLGTLLYLYQIRRLKKKGVNLHTLFNKLPTE